ncbi:MAG: hypothetical protein ACK559_00440, partial [bacterium]
MSGIAVSLVILTPQISLGIKTGIEKCYGRRVISGEAFITYDIGTKRASRLLKNTEKLYIYT